MQMQANNQPAVNSTNTGSGRSKKLGLESLIIVIVVAAVIVGLIYHHNHNSSQASSSGPYKFTYSKLNSFLLSGQSEGNGLSVNKPQEIGPGTAGAPGSEATLYQTAKSGGVRIAALAVSSEAGVGSSSSYVKLAIQSNLADTSSYGYLLFVKPAQQLIKNALDSAYKFSFSNSTTFTSANIKSDAWRIDFAASASGSSNLPRMQGTIVIAVSSKAIYDLDVSAVDYNWNNNQPIWQQVLNTIKIDQ